MQTLQSIGGPPASGPPIFCAAAKPVPSSIGYLLWLPAEPFATG